MSRTPFYLLLLLVLLFGTPSAALVIYRMMGSWNAVGIEADGSATAMEFGPDVARPDWVPVLPGADIVGASRVTASKHYAGFGSIEVASRASLDEIKAFYMTRLRASGFEVSDLGTGPLNPATARYLGIDSMIEARRAATGDQVNVQIRSPEGLLFPTRLVQLGWRKLDAASGPAAR